MSLSLLDTGGAIETKVGAEVEVEGRRVAGDSERSLGGGGAAIDRPYRPAIEGILGATTVVILPDIVGNRALCARYVNIGWTAQIPVLTKASRQGPASA
jgi:hypothetical protein